MPIAALELSAETAEDTRAIAEAVGASLVAGDLVSLTGELGAGKTTFVQGAVRPLGVRDPVVSPTFTLVREYSGTVPVHHVDVYRLDRIQDVLDLGFDEMLDDGSVVFVEWGDAIDTILPAEHLEVRLSLAGDEDGPDDGEGDRRAVSLVAHGASWDRRWGAVTGAVSRWRSPGGSS
jgi:tRNA threonylcarbamoyladenosine biosynthesis protein TsaE